MHIVCAYTQHSINLAYRDLQWTRTEIVDTVCRAVTSIANLYISLNCIVELTMQEYVIEISITSYNINLRILESYNYEIFRLINLYYKVESFLVELTLTLKCPLGHSWNMRHNSIPRSK